MATAPQDPPQDQPRTPQAPLQGLTRRGVLGAFGACHREGHRPVLQTTSVCVGVFTFLRLPLGGGIQCCPPTTPLQDDPRTGWGGGTGHEWGRVAGQRRGQSRVSLRRDGRRPGAGWPAELCQTPSPTLTRFGVCHAPGLPGGATRQEMAGAMWWPGARGPHPGGPAGSPAGGGGVEMPSMGILRASVLGPQ